VCSSDLMGRRIAGPCPTMEPGRGGCRCRV